MNGRCPFCWDKNTKKIAEVAMNSTGRTRILMECPDCEKWYWEDNGEEVHELAELCFTLTLEPEVCEEIILHPIRAGYFSSPRTKIIEFNHICAGCRNKRFVLEERRAAK